MTTFFPVRLTLTHSLRLHIAFSYEKSHFFCFVLEGEEGEILRLTEGPGDLQLGGVDDWLTFLPGDVLTVVVTRPDLLFVLDLPEAGAVLLGHVLTLVYRLVVLLGHHRLLALLQGLVLHDHLEIQAVLHAPVHRAVGEELHLTLDLRDGEAHRLDGHLLALLVQLGLAHREVLHLVVAISPVLQGLTEVLLSSQDLVQP